MSIIDDAPVGAASSLPTGTVTLLFTDIEGSTRLLAALGDGYINALNAHREVVRQALADHAGYEVDTQGDAFFAAFADADAAVAAAVAMQRGLVAAGSPVRLRIGIHTGTPARNQDGYVGLDLHRGARICAVGHGGQVVLSETTQELLTRRPERVRVRPLGTHQLKDLPLPVRLADLVIDGLPDDFPPLRSIGSRPTNLPHELGDLVGRGEDLERAAAAIIGGVRLLTLTGPGGTGKTSLATHVAARLASHFDDGVYVVQLAAVSSAGQVAGEITRTLGLRERPGVEIDTVLHDYLRARRMLLCVDNFEHVLDARSVLDGLLAAAGDVSLLVTSRTPLRLRAEREHPVGPLAVGGAPERAGRDSPAVELFVARAAQARPGFDADEETRAAVAEICRRLDGLPLAIELAAARCRMMSPPAILARLDRPFDVVSGGSRYADDRQRTLRATISWSVDLLDEPLRRAFRRLGVFAAPFSLDAAEKVCDVGLDELAELLEHSLLRPVTGADQDRLGMLETIRAFATELLEASDECTAVRDRHAAWAARLAAHGGPVLLNGEHERHLHRFDAEHEDLLAALDWLQDKGDANAALALAADLAVFWETRGHLNEAHRRLQVLLTATTRLNPPERDRARALFTVGRLTMFRNRSEQSLAALSEALSIFERVGTARDIVVCRSHLASSGGAGDEIVALARSHGDPWVLGVALNNLADSLKEFDPHRAKGLLDECLELRRVMNEKRPLAITLGNIGDVHWALGDTPAARSAYQECLATALDIGYDLMIVDAQLGLAQVALATGRVDDAHALATEALAGAERIDDPEAVARARLLLSGARASG